MSATPVIPLPLLLLIISDSRWVQWAKHTQKIQPKIKCLLPTLLGIWQLSGTAIKCSDQEWWLLSKSFHNYHPTKASEPKGMAAWLCQERGSQLLTFWSRISLFWVPREARFDNNKNFQEIPRRFNFLILLSHRPSFLPLTPTRGRSLSRSPTSSAECLHPFGQTGGTSEFLGPLLPGPLRGLKGTH